MMITDSMRQSARETAAEAGFDPDEIVSISGPVLCQLDTLTDGPEIPIWMSFVDQPV